MDTIHPLSSPAVIAGHRRREKHFFQIQNEVWENPGISPPLGLNTGRREMEQETYCIGGLSAR